MVSKISLLELLMEVRIKVRASVLGTLLRLRATTVWVGVDRKDR
jgi:hypothetical protein